MGIKLGERRGFAVAAAVSGQAEAKGALAGDIILAIGGFLVPLSSLLLFPSILFLL